MRIRPYLKTSAPRAREPDPVAAIRSAWAALKPGGWLVALDWYLPTDPEEQRQMMDEHFKPYNWKTKTGAITTTFAAVAEDNPEFGNAS